MYSLDWFRRPGLFRRILNLWPPMWGAGISVREVSDDFRYGKVRLRMGLTNRNFMGTHFGGSLFAMTDMMYVFMLLRYLGEDHIVWDQSANIQFVKPGRGDVYAEFFLTEERVEAIRARAASGEKCLEEFDVEVQDKEGKLIAKVKRTVYIRLKKNRQQVTGKIREK